MQTESGADQATGQMWMQTNMQMIQLLKTVETMVQLPCRHCACSCRWQAAASPGASHEQLAREAHVAPLGLGDSSFGVHFAATDDVVAVLRRGAA